MLNRKKIHIKTYGCQMNVYDSGTMESLMEPLGYDTTNNCENADLVILNTCHIREKASEKVFSELGRLKKIKFERAKKGEKTLIAVSGCVAQAEGDSILKRAPYVDIIFGPQTTHLLPELVTKANRLSTTQIESSFPVNSKFDYLPIPKTDGPSAFLSIQEGCDKFCTFCVVPYTRGEEYSRPAMDILDEAKVLAQRGVKEITLLGQNVNAYHGESIIGQKIWGLGRLIREIAEIDGINRIRYTTSHPRDLSDEIIDAHKSVDKLMPHLHLPVQSGSDRILKAMNRKHTCSDYLYLIDKLRKAKPDIAVSSDFIVGFPGETDEDFENTLQLVRDVNFTHSFSFKFSIRPGTPASYYKKQVSNEIKSKRLLKLQKLLDKQNSDFNETFVGKKMAILIKGKGKGKGQMLGSSPYLQPVRVENSSFKLGETHIVDITKAEANSLLGKF